MRRLAMKILYVSQYFPPEMGAPAARAWEFSRRWAAGGNDVTVLTTFPNHPTGVVHDGYRGRLFMRERREGVDVVRTFIYAAANKGVVLRSLNYVSFLLSATTQGTWTTPRPEVIVATSPQFLCGLAGWILSVLKRRPFVFEVRDLWPDSIVAVGAMAENHAVVRALRRLERFLYRRADAIVIVSEAFREGIVARGGSPGAIHLVTNGADVDRFRPPEDPLALKKAYGLEGRFVASFVGTLGMAHGLDTVLDAAALLADDPRIALWLVGEGARKDELKRAATARGLPNVVFHDQIARERVPDVLGATDVSLVLLKRADLFKTVIPSKMFEAMAVARPIVLGVEGQAKAILDQAGAGIAIVPEDARALAGALRTLQREPDLAARLGGNGLAFVRRDYSHDALASRYLDVLRAVCDAASAR